MNIKKIEKINGFINGCKVKGEYLTYGDLKKAINSVPCECPEVFVEVYVPANIENGEKEVLQWRATDAAGAELILACTSDTVVYVPGMDLYLWGISFAGISFDLVNTEVRNEAWNV